jgi:hypothetical protein
MVHAKECGVQGSGFKVQGSGFMDQGSRFRVQGSGFKVQGLGFRVQGSGFRVQGLGFNNHGAREGPGVGLERDPPEVLGVERLRRHEVERPLLEKLTSVKVLIKTCLSQVKISRGRSPAHVSKSIEHTLATSPAKRANLRKLVILVIAHAHAACVCYYEYDPPPSVPGRTPPAT